MDCVYKPWHSVEYFRYIRFYPNGKAITLTTPDDPIASLPKLKLDNNLKQTNVLVGDYRVTGSDIHLVFDKKTSNTERKKGRTVSSSSHFTYIMVTLSYLFYRSLIFFSVISVL